MDPVPDTLLLRKSGSAGNRTRERFEILWCVKQQNLFVFPQILVEFFPRSFSILCGVLPHLLFSSCSWPSFCSFISWFRTKITCLWYNHTSHLPVHTIAYWYLLTPWCRVLLEKLTGLQLVKKVPAFYGTRRFITAFTRFHHPSLSWASPIQSTCPQPTSWRSILILSIHLRLGRPSGLFPSDFPTRSLYAPSPPPYEPHAQPISFFCTLPYLL